MVRDGKFTTEGVVLFDSSQTVYDFYTDIYWIVIKKLKPF